MLNGHVLVPPDFLGVIFVSTMWELLRDSLRFLTTISRSRAALAAEILFLRKQLAYYQDHQIRPRRLHDASRLCLLLWSRLFAWPVVLVVVKTSPFIRGHRKGFNLSKKVGTRLSFASYS